MYIESPDRFQRRRQITMTGQEQDVQLFVEHPDLFNHLVAMQREHQVVQDQQVKMLVFDPLDCFQRIGFTNRLIATPVQDNRERIDDTDLIIHDNDPEI